MLFRSAVCKDRYKAEEMGFINNAKILGRRLAFQGLEVDDDRHARVMQAWQAQYDGQDIRFASISKGICTVSTALRMR